MVSFWPFKGHDSSAASFEKLLSALSAKINKESARNDKLRQSQRRYRVLWTLYTSFAYILAALILTLVTGWSNWTAAEYTGLAGGPLVIYGVRTGLDAYFNYRVAASQTYLNDLNKQRDTAIAKLKEATKYNSTQQLLDKYGGKPEAPQPLPSGSRRVSGRQDKPAQAPVQRTGIAPPPTANIPGRQQPQFPISPPGARPPQQNGQRNRQQASQFPPQHAPSPQPQSPADPTAEFAPNAFTSAAQPSTQEYTTGGGPRWYDRILDVVLGDDETQPKNRIVLICQSCRLVNGQAPPGTRSLDSLGQWRCSACGVMNGHEGEAKQMIQRIVGSDDADKDAPKRRATTLDGSSDAAVVPQPPNARPAINVKDELDDNDDDDENDDDGRLEDSSPPPAGSTRSKVRQRKKN
ncbi:hypothetical protein MBLNU459_g1844t1 [Dothideomycetes sp. NU459]